MGSKRDPHSVSRSADDLKDPENFRNALELMKSLTPQQASFDLFHSLLPFFIKQ